jgi:hypothetical protein
VGGDIAAAQPRLSDHRCSAGGADGRELEVQPALAGVAERRCLLGIAVDLPDGVVDIDERDLVTSGVCAGEQPRRPYGEPGQQSGVDSVQLLHMPWVKDRKNVPSVEGARTPANNLPMPPWRSRPRSSSESAPASIPPTTHPVFTAAFGEGTDNCPRRS